MKKPVLIIALCALAVVSHATTFYDSIFTTAAQAAVPNNVGTTKSTTFTGSLPRSTMGGVFAIDSGSFSLTSLTFDLANFGTTALLSQTISVKIYDDLNVAAINSGTTANAFQGNQILNANATFNFSGTGLAASTYTPATITGITGVTIDSSHVYGISLSSGTNNVSFGITYGAANYVGDDLGFDGYFRDASGDGVIQGNEGRALSGGQTFQNLGLKLDGIQAVPEPTTITALGLGAVALLRRRKKG